MFTTNEGTLDRALRLLLGAALLAWFFFDTGAGALHYAKLLGIPLLLTGLIGNCPLYSLIGVATCPVKRD